MVVWYTVILSYGTGIVLIVKVFISQVSNLCLERKTYLVHSWVLIELSELKVSYRMDFDLGC